MNIILLQEYIYIKMLFSEKRLSKNLTINFKYIYDIIIFSNIIIFGYCIIQIIICELPNI